MDMYNDEASPPPGPPPLSPPAASSLYGIARRYCREKILVQPLHWTNRHLELLRISFNEPSPAPSTGQSDSAGKYAGLTCMETYFEKFHLLESRESNIRSLFEERESPFVSHWSRLTLYVDRCWVKAVPCELIHLREPNTLWWAMDYSIGAYIDRSRIEDMRKNSLQRYKCGSYNPPIHALFLHDWKNLNPPNPLNDPYIVAMLIVIAQQRREHLRETQPEELSTLTVYPSQVLTSFESIECVHLYKADIPSSLLDMFDYPTVAPPVSPPISIQIFTVPLKPIATFPNRLFTLMLQTTPIDSPRNKHKRKRTG